MSKSVRWLFKMGPKHEHDVIIHFIQQLNELLVPEKEGNVKLDINKNICRKKGKTTTGVIIIIETSKD